MVDGPRIYNLFPLLVGSVPKWESHLQRIAAMGFNWIYVNPFHYPGFSGSLYAVKDYYRLHELMGDGKNNLEVLISSFCRRAAEVNLSVIMDLVINHTARDSNLAKQYPQWFRHETDGSLYSPRAIDPADARQITIWGDLAELDYAVPANQAALVNYFGNVISYFINCGIRGFRCDAAYKIPAEVWYNLIHFSRFKRWDTVFFAETLGCKIDSVRLLQSSGFNYIFNSVKWWDFKQTWLLEQYESFRHIAPSIAFPESHDTNRLVSDLNTNGVTDPVAIRQSYCLHYLRAATFSTGLMMPIGYEFGFSRKLHVVTTRPEDWEQPRFDLTDWITTVNCMKATTVALNTEGPQHRVNTDDPVLVCLVRRIHGSHPWAVTYMNPDLHHAHSTRVWGLDVDMDENREVTPGRISTVLRTGDSLLLEPGEVRIFTNL